jgi:hypothetical protein
MNEVIATAKAKAAGEPSWLRAIDKAVAEIESNPFIEFQDNHLLILSAKSGEIYEANGTCGCQAFRRGLPCYHRAAARLITRYLELAA